MPSNIYIVTDSSPFTFHLAGGGSPWNGSGTPWTAQTTSPYRVAMNDVTGGVYTPTAAPPTVITSGGPPFLVGSDLAYQSYGNVTETIGVQMRATSHNNAVALLRELRRVLSRSLMEEPPILAIQPNNASSVSFFEIVSATVQELPQFINQEANNPTLELRALLTITRKPLAGNSFGLTAGETLLNAVTMTNNGTGANPNLRSLGTAASGEMIYAGGPLNVRLVPSALNTEFLLATAYDRIYAANVSSLVTSSTSGLIPAATAANISTLQPFRESAFLRGRVIIRVTNPSANLQVRARLYNTSGAVWHTGPWVSMPGATASTVLIDLGPVNPAFARLLTIAAASTLFTVAIDSRSTNGAATTGTMVSIEWLIYYTFGSVYMNDSSVDAAVIETFMGPQSGRVGQPKPVDAYNEVAGALRAPWPFRGRPPAYFYNMNLWLGMRLGATWVTNTAHTAAVTVTHLPLFQTLRGNG